MCFRDDGMNNRSTPPLHGKTLLVVPTLQVVAIDTEQPSAVMVDANDDIASTDLAEIHGNTLLT